MNITYRHSGVSISSIEELIEKYPDTEFNSPQRSTIPSLIFWMDTENRVHELSGALDLVPPQDCTVEFEYLVAPPAGQGKKSHTDVMLWCGTTCIGVEAKYTEPPYEEVSRWLTGGSNPANRLKVLGGWCDIISEVTGKKCSVDSLGELTYQMIHRIASVCSRPEKQKHLLYQIFDPQPGKTEFYREQLRSLKEVLEIGSSVGIHIATVPVSCLEAHSILVKEWQKNKKLSTCRNDVKVGLKNRNLMSCGQLSIETI